MFKKFTVFLAAALVLIFSVNALDINDLNGEYYILKSDLEGDFSFVSNLRLTKLPLRELSQKVTYRVETDVRYEVSQFEFMEMDGDIYASFKSGENKDKIYWVKEKTEFAITLVNVDDNTEVVKLVLDKEATEYDYDGYYDGIDHMTDNALIDKLHDLIDNQKALGYTGSRKVFFGRLDNINGQVECVYTGRKIKTSGIPNHTNMNCEHTWPQSKFGGSEKGTKKCDLHHLFPTDSKANSKRGNVPLRNVSKASWSQGGSKYGTGELGGTVFEPRDEHKGDVARAMFYFAVRYKMSIDAHQENTFRKWHKEDPVSEKEIRRNAGIEEAQGNRNPFIDRPDLVDNISDF